MQEYKNIKQQRHWQQEHWNHKAYIQHSNRTGYLVVSPSQSATLCVSFSLFAAVASVAAAVVAAASFVVPLEIPLHYPVLAYVASSFHDSACICQNTHEHHYCLLDVMPSSLIISTNILQKPTASIFIGRVEVYTQLPDYIWVDVHVHHGSPTHSPPGCIMWPVATFASRVCSIKITQ
jgi:hypothetical protein